MKNQEIFYELQYRIFKCVPSVPGTDIADIAVQIS